MMRWLTNLHDPRRTDISPYETPDRGFHYQESWLADKIIGEPKATEAYSVEQLKKMGMVGIYAASGEANRAAEIPNRE